MSNCNHNNCTCGELAAPQRNHYFYGKLLDETNLRMEQEYLNHKRWMLNRHGLGKGVLCGLTVTWTTKQVCISAGIAIDGCGREIVVPCPITIDPWQITDDCGRPGTRLPAHGVFNVYFCLAFVECPTDYVPVLVTDCDSANKTASSTTVEKFAVVVKQTAAGVPPPLPIALDPDICLALADPDPEVKRKNICGILSQRACAGSTTEPCVVIVSNITLTNGLITAVDVCSARPVVYGNPALFEMLLCRATGSGGGGPGPQGPAGPGIDAVNLTMLACGQLPWATLSPNAASLPNQILNLGIPTCCDDKLTRITKTNWAHDGAFDWADFLKDGLQIDFSGEVAAKPNFDHGWIQVSLELSGGARRKATNPLIQFVSLMFGFVWPSGSRLVYRMEAEKISVDADNAIPRYHARFQPRSELITMISVIEKLLVGDFIVLCRVVVNCDFLVDADGKPIDGNFLNGATPTGDGTRGGQFESWFELMNLNQPIVAPIPPVGRMVAVPPRMRGDVVALERVAPGIADLAKFFKIED